MGKRKKTDIQNKGRAKETMNERCKKCGKVEGGNQGRKIRKKWREKGTREET